MDGRVTDRIAKLVWSSTCYKDLTPDEIEDFNIEGMALHPEKLGRLTCNGIHCRKGQGYKEFQSSQSVRLHFLEHEDHMHNPFKAEETVQPGAIHRMKAAPSSSVGQAARSSSQRSSHSSSATLRTTQNVMFEPVTNIISQAIVEFVIAFVDLWILAGTMDRSWGKLPERLLRVPPCLQPIMSLVRVGRSKQLSWDMLCRALGTSVFSDGCKTVEGIARVADEWIRAGPLLGLFARAFKILIDQICRQDQHSSTGFVVAIVAAMNTHSRKSLSEMCIRCKWSNLRVASIKIEAQFCAPQAKNSRVTHPQSASGVIRGRYKRAM